MTLDQQAWDERIKATEHQSFLQSWAWREFKEATGVPIKSLTIEEEGKITAASHLITRPLPFGWHWLYAPFAPYTATPQAAQKLRAKMVQQAKEEESIFLRVESDKNVTEQGWRPAPHVQPQHTAVLDLGPSEEELLARMHSKTRYNIRLAQRKGVKIRFSKQQQDIDTLLKLGEEVSQRSGFHLHPPLYYHQLLETLGQKDMVDLVIAEYENQPLVVYLLLSFGQTTYYLHGSSSSEQRAVMAPHLAQWEAIKWAKAKGKKRYDFWGVAPVEAGARHPWAGITRFKLGFGAERVHHPAARDWVFQPLKYQMYRLAKARLAA